MESFGIGLSFGAAAVAVLWWYVDSHGGAKAIEKQVTDQAKPEAGKLAGQAESAVKAEITKAL